MGKARTGPWTEVNILPASAREPERLLADVAAHLVHGLLRGNYDRWHFFWEPELRLRFRWRSQLTARTGRRILADHLRCAADRGDLVCWAEVPYDGEADDYGPEVWEAMTADWMSGSELALAVIQAGDNLPGPREFYWERHTHLFANQLNVPEVTSHLEEAYARIKMGWPSWPGHPPFADMIAAIDRFLAGNAVAEAEASGRPAALEKRLAAPESQISR